MGFCIFISETQNATQAGYTKIRQDDSLEEKQLLESYKGTENPRLFETKQNIYRAVKSNIVKGLFLFVFVCLFNLFILIQFGNPDLKNAFFCCAG